MPVINPGTILSGVIVALLAALFMTAGGLLFTRWPLKNSNQVLRLNVADYKAALELSDRENAALAAELKDLRDKLAAAQTEITKLSTALAQMAVANTALQTRVSQLEAHHPAPPRRRAPSPLKDQP